MDFAVVTDSVVCFPRREFEIEITEGSLTLALVVSSQCRLLLSVQAAGSGSIPSVFSNRHLGLGEQRIAGTSNIRTKATEAMMGEDRGGESSPPPFHPLSLLSQTYSFLLIHGGAHTN